MGKPNFGYNIEKKVVEAIINNKEIDLADENYPMTQTVEETRKGKGENIFDCLETAIGYYCEDFNTVINIEN